MWWRNAGCCAIAAGLCALVLGGPLAAAPIDATPATSRIYIVSAIKAPPQPTVTPSSRPEQLPSHFAIGVSAHPDATGLHRWMPDTGVPWDYAYQYLAGGVNTGGGWQHWNEQAQFPLWYARDAAERGYIPVFPYYMLLQSSGPCDGCGESQQDLAHLNDPALMAVYYADFAKLMQRLGSETHDGIQGFGGTAIVHVEPDLSGYAMQAVLDNGRCDGHCTGEGNDPALLRAAVASSGVPELADLPNAYQGFSWALLRLRDRYAPNVLLAFHVSNWVPIHDVGSNTDPSLDVAGLGTAAGQFAARAGTIDVPAGVSPYDLVFNDVADRDAGHYTYGYGRQNVFWDRLNVALPNFHRWETYLTSAVRAAGRPAMVWQIPLGNQVYRSMNNTDGHYQDNRAEYFFEHVEELIDAGVIGLLFGAGNAGSTVTNDGKRDGVTNPAPTCTTDGMSTGQICADRESVVADDDGGYLREAAGQYYAAPRPLP